MFRLFWWLNCIIECWWKLFMTTVFKHLQLIEFSKTFMIKQAPRTYLAICFLKFLKTPWIHYRIVNRLPEKRYQKRAFVLTLVIYWCELMYRSFFIYSQTSTESFLRLLWMDFIRKEFKTKNTCCITNCNLHILLADWKPFLSILIYTISDSHLLN